MSAPHLPIRKLAGMLSVILLALGLSAAPALATSVEPPASNDHVPPTEDDSTGTLTPEPTSAAAKAATAQVHREICHDDLDNDGDSLIDCDDLEDCKAFATCGWIMGGWLWIWTIFDVTLGALVLYAWFITVRLRRARSEGASTDV